MQTNLSVASGATSSRIELGLRALAWGLLSFVGFIATFMILVWPVSQLEQALRLPHPVHLGICALAWVPASGLLALAAARVTFRVWPEVRTLAWLILLIGALVSAAHIGVLANWAIRRYGASDPDFIGPTFSLFGVIAGAAVAGFMVQIAPRRTVWLPVLAIVAGVAFAISITASNIPGLADGLGRDSGPLAVATVGAALYIGVVAAISVARLRRS